ncbi:MAG: hypothetical protein Ct9H90mP14_0750 [Methanobacteriota archaeon]|nr:MAG: hypothetical protein Ct9H90mP14_0750 [Euryarchaeota archaeon]
MAKKDTYLALLRRGIDENTAQLLADSGIKVGDPRNSMKRNFAITTVSRKRLQSRYLRLLNLDQEPLQSNVT